MKSKIERDYEREQRRLREIYEIYKQLPPWDKFEFILFVYWKVLKSYIESLPLNWIKFILDMERQLELHGMPYALKLKLEKWFNYPPHSDKKYFIWQGMKVWYHCWVEEDYFELHLYRKGKYPGMILFEIGKDGIATIIGINIQKEFRGKGLGTMAFQESLHQLRDRITCLKGVLEKEYYPEPEDSLCWLRKQGFEVKEKESGDYEVELRIN